MIFKRKYRSAKKDFTVEDLPANRYEVFMDILKLQWGKILFLGLILLLSSLPFLLTRYYHLLVTTNYLHQVESGEMEKEIALKAILGFNNLINLIYLPLIVFFAICLAGIVKIIKNLIWSEYTSFRHDFLAGIKENGLHLTVIFFLLGLLNLGYAYFKALNIFTETYANNIFSYLPVVSLVALVFPLLLYFVSLTAIYQDKIIKKVIIGVKLFLLNFPKTILFCLVGLFPLFFLFINNSLFQLLFPIFYVFIYLPVFLIIWFLFSCSVFDKYINQKNFPEIVDKGIWRQI